MFQKLEHLLYPCSLTFKSSCCAKNYMSEIVMLSISLQKATIHFFKSIVINELTGHHSLPGLDPRAT